MLVDQRVNICCFVVFWGVGSMLDVVSEGVETLNQIQLTINT